MKEIALIIFFTYLFIATIIYFKEMMEDGSSFILHLFGFAIVGMATLLLPLIPLLILLLIPEEFMDTRRVIGSLYLVVLIIFGARYLINDSWDTEKNKSDLEKDSKNNIVDNKDVKAVYNEKKIHPETDNKLVGLIKIEKEREYSKRETGIKTQQEAISDVGSNSKTFDSISEKEEFRRVNYSYSINENENSYPILKLPNNDCIIRSYKIGKTKRRGFKEESFQELIFQSFSSDFQILGNVRLNTGKSTRPFEPDIAIISKGIKNIRIDIEIDEPYAGITRQPTHCIGEDNNRDNYFKDRGWIVIRFSEYQVHTRKNQCLKYIATVIKSIDSSYKIPSSLKVPSDIKNEKLWDIVQAQKWERANYREEYLNHTFVNTPIEVNDNNYVNFSRHEIEEEKLVKPTFIGNVDRSQNIGFNKLNKHFRDDRIKFSSKEHAYTIDNVPAPSATSLISKFFLEFDTKYWTRRKATEYLNGEVFEETTEENILIEAERIRKEWKDKGTESVNKGTFLHEQIENYYLDLEYEEPEGFYQFLSFVADHNNLKPYRSEWRIFDESHNIAGTIDLLVENNNGTYDMYDWKRSKKLVDPTDGKINTDNYGKTGIGILEHIPDTSFNRYQLQQNIYRYILEEKYNLRINNMYLIVMHTDEGYNNYHKLKVHRSTKEVNNMLDTL